MNTKCIECCVSVSIKPSTKLSNSTFNFEENEMRVGEKRVVIKKKTRNIIVMLVFGMRTVPLVNEALSHFWHTIVCMPFTACHFLTGARTTGSEPHTLM